MTHTLDLRDVLDESASASKRTFDRTYDLRSLLQRHDEGASQRWIVRNLVVMTGPDRAQRTRSRASFDLDRGAMIEVERPAVGGELDWDRLAASIARHVARGSLWAHDAAHATERGVRGLSNTSGAAGAMDTAERLARSAFPAGAFVEWRDVLEDDDGPFNLMVVVSPGSAEEIHAAYLAFMRSWVREETPERRRSIRVACRASGSA